MTTFWRNNVLSLKQKCADKEVGGEKGEQGM